MKREIIKQGLIAAAALLAVPVAVLAQKEKNDEVVVQGYKKDAKEKGKHQTIVITRTGESEGKTVIEIDGDKVKVNGKDAKESRDVNVNVTTLDMSRPGTFRMTAPGRQAWTMNMNNDGLFFEDENRAMLGVNTEGNEKGAEIITVTKESAADKLGLKKGDIITKVDGKNIESSDDLTEAIRAHKPGDKVAVTYLREGKEQKGNTELTKWKGLDVAVAGRPRINGRINGTIDGTTFDGEFLNIDPPTPPAVAYGAPGMRYERSVYGSGRRLGLSIQDTDEGSGVKVLEVEEEGAAAKAGLKEGDIIVKVDETDVKGTDDVTRTIRSNREKSNFNFRVKRDGKEQNVEVKFPKKLKTADL